MGANNKFSSKFEFKKMENSSDHSPSWNEILGLDPGCMS